MDDQALDMLCSNFDYAVTVSDDNFKTSSIRDQTLEIPKIQTEKLEGNSEIVEESKESVGEYNESNDDTEETCSYLQQTLPIFQKIENLSSKIHHLRKEHAVLCNEVKDITANSFPGSEVSNALQSLSVEHENLKKKYHEDCELLKKKYHEECELLKKKYIEEYNERKRLYNEVIELKGNIRVFCRCRPLNLDEISNGSPSVIDFDSCQENELQIISSDSSKKLFKFDHVFRPEDNQEVVFVQTMPIVMSILDGFNVCIFAYGQTGTGKTFTMEGTPENRGVNYRTLEELFKISKERITFMKYELFVSMLEVYNEKIRDLLVENSNQPPKKLEIKQSAEGTQEVPGLVEARVHSTNEVWELLKSGSRARSVGSTNANELSSRSHCLVRVTVLGENLINGQRTRSHLWLVDLAGSERVARLEVEGERLKESQFINKSLSALGDVVSALASKAAHIPYRNSKLTHMLQSSLGGDCKTLMFVQISPNAADLGETLCSLNFASRVRGVEHGPARKQADIGELYKYKQLAEKAKNDEKETKKLQDNLQSLQLRLSAREHICRNLQEKLAEEKKIRLKQETKVRDLENQLAEERKIRLNQETKALSAVTTTQPSALSSLGQSQRTTTEKKPPLAPPTKLRLPLRRITNFMPAHSPGLPYKTRNSMIPFPRNSDKENASLMETCKTKTLMKPKRLSIAVRPATTAKQVLQPKRRASIATFRPESNSSMKTPLNRSNVQLRMERVVGRQSFVWDPQRVWRTTKVSSPMSQLRGESFSATVEETPINPRSRKFVGSPPSHAGSWKPKHPTVVALQKKQLVWSPLKMKAMRNSSRKSFLS